MLIRKELSITFFQQNTSHSHEIWERSYGGANEFERGESIQQTSDGGYIIAGVYSPVTWSNWIGDQLIIKTDEDGEVLWETTYGGNGDEWAHYILETFDKAFIVAGRTSSFGAGGKDIWHYKLILSPQEAIEYVIYDIVELVNSDYLNQGQGNALIVKLKTAIKKLNQVKTKTAINLLQAFINQ